MSKYNQKPFTAEEKRKAIDNYAEKIQYSARYSSESQLDHHPMTSFIRGRRDIYIWGSADRESLYLQVMNGSTGV